MSEIEDALRAEVQQLESENASLRKQIASTQHRIRNTLGVIRSIARRSAETSESVEDYAMHLDGRIGAFARVQGALLRDPDGGMSLETIVLDTLQSALVREGDRLAISGPSTTLRPKAAELLGLAFHELATNAIKFGALASGGGKLNVDWTIEAGPPPIVSINWIESGAQPSVPTRHGFGTEFLERTLSYELGATAETTFTADGLVCRLVIPADACLLATSATAV